MMSIRDDEIIMKCIDTMEDILSKRKEDVFVTRKYNRQANSITLDGELGSNIIFSQEGIWIGDTGFAKRYPYDSTRFKGEDDWIEKYMTAIYNTLSYSAIGYLNQSDIREIADEWISKQYGALDTSSYTFLRPLYSAFTKKDRMSFIGFENFKWHLYSIVGEEVASLLSNAVEDNNPEKIIKFATMLNSFPLEIVRSESLKKDIEGMG